MKKIFMAFLCLLFSAGISNTDAKEENTLNTVSAAGENFEAGSHSLNWTIGEGFIDLHQNNSSQLNEGFHQVIIEEVTSARESSVATDEFSVYPNPASDYINVEGGSKYIKQITVTDISGKTVILNDDIRNLSYKINISGFTAGTYYLEIITEDNTIHQYKIQKIK